jgi:hypothetical protein
MLFAGHFFSRAAALLLDPSIYPAFFGGCRCFAAVTETLA